MGRRVTREGNVISDIAHSGVVWFSMPAVGIFKRKLENWRRQQKRGLRAGDTQYGVRDSTERWLGCIKEVLSWGIRGLLVMKRIRLDG